MMGKDGLDMVIMFVSAVEKTCLMGAIDKEVLDQGSKHEIENQSLLFVELALKCIANKGIDRPILFKLLASFG